MKLHQQATLTIIISLLLITSLNGYATMPTNELNKHLWQAVKQGNPREIQIALNNGADVNAKYTTCKFKSMTVLMLATANRNIDIVKLLLKNGVNVNAVALLITPQHDDGITALRIAELNNYSSIGDTLIMAGATFYDAERRAIEMDRRAKTLIDLRSLATALGSYYVDFDKYPKSALEQDISRIHLPKNYYAGSYKDQWGTPYKYMSNETNYILLSYGADRKKGGGENEFDTDLKVKDGHIMTPLEDSSSNSSFEGTQALSEEDSFTLADECLRRKVEKRIEGVVMFAFINYSQDVQKNLMKNIVDLLEEVNAAYDKNKIIINVDEQKKEVYVDLEYSLLKKSHHFRVKNTSF